MPRRILRVARGLAFIPGVRIALWALLALSVVLTATGVPSGTLERLTGSAPAPWLHLAPAVVFALFLIGFSVYRITLVRGGRYHAGKAFVQLGLGALVLTLLLPQNLARYRAAGDAPPLTRPSAEPLLDSDDPAVRALACEVLAFRRGEPEALAKARALAQSDPDPQVRALCARVGR